MEPTAAIAAMAVPSPAAGSRQGLARVRPAGRFIAHYAEMVISMIVGMTVLGIPVDALARAAGHANLYHELPLVGAIVMTVIMALPMGAWMAIRRHDRRMILEMVGAMVVPAAGLIAASVAGLISPSSIPSLTDPLMYGAMLLVMLARWRMYAGLGHGEGGPNSHPVGAADGSRAG